MSPLVSVIVSAYNSSLYIKETLNSIKGQTWKNIELIISDDCSVDNTVEVCNEWINIYSSRFFKVSMLQSEINTGISGNANRGLHESKGEWIKFIGADDTLKPTCIEDNLNWIWNSPATKVLFSKVDIYNGRISLDNYLETTEDDSEDPRSIMSPHRDSESQYKMLLVSDRIHYSPSLFVNRNTLLSVGGFDERYKSMEDYPLWLNLTRCGHRLYFMDKITVNYRKHQNAINNLQYNYLIKPNYFRTETFRRENIYPFLPVDIRRSRQWKWLVSQLFRFDFTNRNIWLLRMIYLILIKYLNPFEYQVFIRSKMSPNLSKSEFYS